MRRIGFVVEQAAVCDRDRAVGAIDLKASTCIIRQTIGERTGSIDVVSDEAANISSIG